MFVRLLMCAFVLVGTIAAAEPTAATTPGESKVANKAAVTAPDKAAESAPVQPSAGRTAAAHETPLFSDAEWSRALPASAAAPASASGGRAAIGLITSLGVVIALAIGLGVVVKRFGMKRILPGRGKHLEIIETVPIGFKRAVTVMRLGDQVLVIGQGEHELHHIATLPASVLSESGRTIIQPLPAQIDGFVSSTVASTASPSTSVFRGVLDQVTGKS